MHRDTKAKVWWWGLHLSLWAIIVGAVFGSVFSLFMLIAIVWVVAFFSMFLLRWRNIQSGAESAPVKPIINALLAVQAFATATLLLFRGHEFTSLACMLSILVVVYYRLAVKDERQFRLEQFASIVKNQHTNQY